MERVERRTRVGTHADRESPYYDPDFHPAEPRSGTDRRATAAVEEREGAGAGAPDVGAREPEELVNAFWAEIELAHGVLGTRMTRGLIAARDALLAALAETREGWRDIATAPRDGTPAIVAEFYVGPHGSRWLIGEACFHESYDGWWWAQQHPTDVQGDRILPTLWQPLPEPPAPPTTQEEPPA